MTTETSEDESLSSWLPLERPSVARLRLVSDNLNPFAIRLRPRPRLPRYNILRVRLRPRLPRYNILRVREQPVSHDWSILRRELILS